MDSCLGIQPMFIYIFDYNDFAKLTWGFKLTCNTCTFIPEKESNSRYSPTFLLKA